MNPACLHTHDCSLRARMLVLAALACIPFALACSRNLEAPPAASRSGMDATAGTLPSAAGSSGAQTRPSGEASASGPSRSAAGVRWRAPESWVIEPDRPMRVVTYKIPAAGPDSEDGECSVFFFGAGQGGDVEANLARWQGQFEPEDGRTAEGMSERATSTIHGIEVTRIVLEGTYLFSPAPMSPQKIRKPGYRMLGAIVAAPAGNVFFKLTGPGSTVTAAEAGFESLVQSLERE